ncbi:MAG: hypothetical protein GF364_10920 [Candidatus Lokiarchaeota archaeon]|nr:hypothetical protein [Candidatus Lokiarchaeota archaeon]
MKKNNNNISRNKIKYTLCALFFAFLSIQLIILNAFGLFETYFIRDDYNEDNYFINNGEKFDDPNFKLRRDLVWNRTLEKGYDEETGVVGSIRDQFYYALALLETPHPSKQNLTRANRVIRAGFNEFYYRAKYFGFRQWNALRKNSWSEDIDDYDSNYVNFVSPYLAYIGIEHWDKLEPATISIVKKCYPMVMGVFYAIHNRIDYTNMWLLRCAGQLMFGIMYDDLSLINVAKNEFRSYVNLIREQGYPEYNSPNYVYIDIWALQCIYSYAPDAEFRWYSRSILEWFYLQYVQNYHPSTGYIAGTSDRMKSGDYWWGLGSHSNIFYQYFGYEKEKNEFGSSGTRLGTNYRYYPSDYIGEIAINKTYPLAVEAINYGIKSYTFLQENYTLGTRSGAHNPDDAGYTTSDLSGEAMEVFLTYNTSYPVDDSKYIRRSAWFDTEPHYNIFNSLQVNGTAVFSADFDIAEKRAENCHYLVGNLADERALTEIRINNTLWDQDPVALNEDSVVNLKINNTYIGLRPIPTKSSDIKGGTEPVNGHYPCILYFEEEKYDDLTWNELKIRNYVYKDDENKFKPDKNSDIYAGFCVEIISEEEIGDFDTFCDLTIDSTINTTYNPGNRIHVLNYTSKVSNVSLYFSENLEKNILVERRINNSLYVQNHLLKSKYTELKLGASIEEVHGILRSESLPDIDNDGLIDAWESTFNLNIGIDDSEADADNDGLTNLMEFSKHTNPLVEDTDGDGLNDYDEITTYLSKNISPLRIDSDGDTILDSREIFGLGDPNSILFPLVYILAFSIAIWISFFLLYYLFKNKLSREFENIREYTEDLETNDGDKHNFHVEINSIEMISPKNTNQMVLISGFSLLLVSHAMEIFVPIYPSNIALYYTSAIFLRFIGMMLLIKSLPNYCREWYGINNVKNMKTVSKILLTPIILINIILSLIFLIHKGFWLYQTLVYYELIFLGLLYFFISIILMRQLKLSTRFIVRNKIFRFLINFITMISGIGISILMFLSTTRNEFEYFLFLLPHILLVIVFASALFSLKSRQLNKIKKTS